MSSIPSVEYRQGQELDGFVVVQATPLPEQRAVAYQLLHSKSGARILHLHNDDTENLFSITFPTPPTDDSGVAHIIEHSVLSGSRKFPVKDPFFEMIKQSMATFINAMTSSDSTYYPVSSNVRQDYYNLAEVYWDAVFYPNLTEMTFLREAHHLEPADKTKPTGELTLQGIVYNEMKGVFSSPSALAGQASFRGLFPDTVYGRESGGDPKAIPLLTYQQFRDFHARYYHPSNAYIFLYGDISTAHHLAWLKPKLDAFTQQAIDVTIADQPRWTEPRQQTITYPIGPTDQTTGKTWITLNWLIGDGNDAEQIMAMSLLEAVLLGNQAALLHKAIIDSGLGEDLAHCGFEDETKQSTFHVGIKGSEADRADAFVELVLTTLRQIVQQGIEPARIDAAFHQLIYSQLEITSHYPLQQLGVVKAAWMHGKDPLTFVRGAQLLDKLRQRYRDDPQIFTRLIQRYLIDNPHRLTLICAPDQQLAARQEADERQSLSETRQKMTEADLQHIAQQTAELDRLADMPNSPEALATLPRLYVKDLPATPREIPTTRQKLADGIELLHNDVLTNGINYLSVDFDLSHLPAELFAYLPLYSDCVYKMGAAGQGYEQIAQRMAAATDGITFTPHTTAHFDREKPFLRRAMFGLKFLDDTAVPALELLHDLIFQLDLDNTDRLHQVLRQDAIAHRSSIVGKGMSLARHHAGHGLSAALNLDNQMVGLPQTRLITRLADQFGSQADQIILQLKKIRAAIANRSGLVISFTGSAKAHALVCQAFERWSGQMKVHTTAPVPVDFSPIRRASDGLANPMKVAFCVRVMPAPHISHPAAPALELASHLVSLDYILDEVRFKGTAYGGGCSYSGASDIWTFYSYRDPHVQRTLQVFDRTLDYIKKADWTQDVVDRAIISSAKYAERPIRPAYANTAALMRHLSGHTFEIRTDYYHRLLTSTADQVKAAAVAQFEQHYAENNTCVVSSREKLAEASLEVQDILDESSPPQDETEIEADE